MNNAISRGVGCNEIIYFEAEWWLFTAKGVYTPLVFAALAVVYVMPYRVAVRDINGFSNGFQENKKKILLRCEDMYTYTCMLTAYAVLHADRPLGLPVGTL